MPYLEDGYWYYTRFETARSTRSICRRQGRAGRARGGHARRQPLAAGHGYFPVGGCDVSPDEQPGWPAAVDTVGPPLLHDPLQGPGDRRDAARRDPRRRPATSSGPTTTAPCSTSSRTRSRCARTGSSRHALGTPAADDVLVYEETDDELLPGHRHVRSSEPFICIQPQSTLSDRVALPRRRPTRRASSASFQPRERDHEYRSTTSATASTSAPTGRRRTSG